MMNTTSAKPMTRTNRKRALIRIQKELQHIVGRTIAPETHGQVTQIRRAIHHVVNAIQWEQGDDEDLGMPPMGL